jgi:hypothetical protein
MLVFGISKGNNVAGNISPWQRLQAVVVLHLS